MPSSTTTVPDLHDGRHVDARGGHRVHHLLHHLAGEHHEVGDGLAQDGVQRDQDGQGQEAPETAGHGVDPLFGVELLHFLAQLRLVVGVLLLQLLHPPGHTVHADHALLRFQLEGKHQELDHQREEDDGHAVGTGHVVEQPQQPGEGDTNDVSNG